jgi:hypothetical protein
MLSFFDLFVFHLSKLSKRVIFFTSLRSRIAYVTILSLKACPSCGVGTLLPILYVTQATQLRKLLWLLISLSSCYDKVVDVIIIYFRAVIDSRVCYVASHVVDYVSYDRPVLTCNCRRCLLDHFLGGRPWFLALALRL